MTSGFGGFTWFFFDLPLHLTTTRKISMEPKNRPIAKKNHLPNLHYCVPCAFFQGVTCFKWLKVPTRQVLSSKVPSVHDVRPKFCHAAFLEVQIVCFHSETELCVQKFFEIQMFRHLPLKCSYPRFYLFPNVPHLSDVQNRSDFPLH